MLAREDVEEGLRVGVEGGVELPAVAPVGRLGVGVYGQHVQRRVVGTERGDHAVAVVGGGVGEVAREPGPERVARQQRRRARERPQVGEPAPVVVAVAEQVAVLILAQVRRPGGCGHRAGAQGRRGVLE